MAKRIKLSVWLSKNTETHDSQRKNDDYIKTSIVTLNKSHIL